MFLRKWIPLFTILISTTIMAQPLSNLPEPLNPLPAQVPPVQNVDVIPIVPNKSSSINYSSNAQKSNRLTPQTNFVSPPKFINITANDLTTFVRHVRDSVCTALGNGDVKTWIGVDASSHALVINPSNESGIEITFYCKEGLATNSN